LEADIKLLVEELEVAKDVAENMLKKHNGNVKLALQSFIRGND